MIKHFGIYTNSGDVQTALNEEILINPYVAKVSGALDYNSIQPVGPCYLGEWSDDGAGNYTFQILDAEATAWENGVIIGQLLGVYFNGEQLNMNVELVSPHSDPNSWTMTFLAGDPSESPNYEFSEGSSEDWTSDAMTDPDYSNSTISASWDGVDTFVFDACIDYPLSMNTINPECETEPTPEPEPTCEEQGLCDDGEGNCVECEPCAGMEQVITDCEGRGGVWDYVNCLCNEPVPEPTCEEACAGDPECECNCQGGVWNGEECELPDPDPCGGDPECECYQQGPDWSWNGEECIYTDPNESGPDESE